MEKLRVRRGNLQILLFFNHLLIIAIANLLLITGDIHVCRAAAEYVPGSTQKIFQLTGNFDNDVKFNKATTNLTNTRFGVTGTDLGVSFTHNGKIYFLFGDTRTGKYTNQALDCIAYTTYDIATVKANRNSKIDLTFNTVPGDSTKFQPPYVQYPSIDQGGCSVPMEGLSANGKMYVYFVTGDMCDDQHGISVLAASSDNGLSFDNLYNFSSTKFMNVQVEEVNTSSTTAYNSIRQYIPAADQGKTILFIWGSGLYRESDPYLAYIVLSDIETKSQLHYFTGIDASSNKPSWSSYEAYAQPLFTQPCFGEFSVSWNSFLKKWLMLFNCGLDPSGINFRVADYPWGPWSSTKVLFNADTDNGYCYFMHRYDCPTAGSGCDDNYDLLQSPGACRGGGSYGPYVINDLTTGVTGQNTNIYFTLSTWNPYQVMLMKSTLSVEPDYITVTSPAANERWVNGRTRTIEWDQSGFAGNVRIELCRPSACACSIIASSTYNSGSYDWSVPAPAENGCRIKITSLNNPAVYDEGGLFDIITSNHAPRITSLNRSFSGSYINQGETISLSASATDPDAGDSLNYTWYVSWRPDWGGTKMWFKLCGPSTMSTCSHVPLDNSFFTQFKCIVNDRTGITDEARTWENWVYATDSIWQ